MEAVKQELAQLQEQLAQLVQPQQQFQAQTTQALAQLQGLSRRGFNTAAKAANTHARGDDRLVLLLDANGMEPPGFPDTKGGICKLAGDLLITLLAAYGLGNDGTFAMRRERLATHVGCL
jgi:hypothetical protein